MSVCRVVSRIIGFGRAVLAAMENAEKTEWDWIMSQPPAARGYHLERKLRQMSGLPD